MSKQRINTLSRSVMERRFVNVTYHTPQPDGTVRVADRSILVSHLYETKEGHVVAVAFDNYRKEVRSFRLDRMSRCRIGKPAPESKPPDGDAIILFPGSYRIRLAKPLAVKAEKAAQYIAAGWKPEPWAAVLRPAA